MKASSTVDMMFYEGKNEMNQLKEEFRTNGYVVLRNFLPAEDISFTSEVI